MGHTVLNPIVRLTDAKNDNYNRILDNSADRNADYSWRYVSTLSIMRRLRFRNGFPTVLVDPASAGLGNLFGFEIVVGKLKFDKKEL